VPAGETVGDGPDLVQPAKRSITQAENARMARFLIERIIRYSHNLSMTISLRSGNFYTDGAIHKLVYMGEVGFN